MDFYRQTSSHTHTHTLMMIHFILRYGSRESEQQEYYEYNVNEKVKKREIAQNQKKTQNPNLFLLM